MNRLSTAERVRIVAALAEGNSVRATCRMTGAAKGTVLKLLVDLGAACWDYQRRTLVNLPCKRIQADEQWAFVYAREANVPEEHKFDFGYGDIFVWTAMCADTRAIVTWIVGNRTVSFGRLFAQDLAGRMANRIQFSSDGLGAYPNALREAFGVYNVDYGQSVKEFGHISADRRYSPPECIGAKKVIVFGDPDPAHISTSYLERYHLTARMSMRRMTRLTNGFSKKLANLQAALAVQTMVYNFARKHQTLGTTPAVKLGVADHVWTLAEVVGLLQDSK